MNPEPSQADVAAVAASMGEPVAPAPQPVAQMQPEAPVSQPAPTQQPTDPFATIFASEPAAPAAAPVEPAAQPAPAPAPAPVEPAAQPQPTQPAQPAPQAPAQTPAPQDDYQSFDDYMSQVMAGVPDAPAQPDPTAINPDDPNAIKGFFDDLMNTAAARAEANFARKIALQNSEKKLWDAAMDKYGSLRTNQELRDMVHNIRVANFQRGVAMTPTQAAEKLLDSLQAQYKQGIADNQVVTTYEQVQPNSGGGGTPMPTSLDTQSTLQAVSDGGETALAAILDAEIKAGRL